MVSTSMFGQLYQNGRFILSEPDKQKHYIAGIVISGLSYEWALKKWEDEEKAAMFSIGMGLAAGIAKESFDNWKGFPSYFDDRDILATVMGSVTITIPLAVFQKPKRRYTH
jgi:hypothetical protein